ncbi:lysostaphin resistance A-like protein [Planctomycetota bacterium]
MTNESSNVNLEEGIILAEVDQPPRRRGAPLVAWAVIIAIVLLIVLRQRDIPEAEANGGIQITDKVFEFQGQYLVAAASISEATKQQLYDQAAQQMNTGSILNRLRFVTIAGELAGPEEALEHLESLRSTIERNVAEVTDEEQSVMSCLSAIYSKQPADPTSETGLAEEQKELLTTTLGWFGKLALTPEDGSNSAARSELLRPAKTTMIAIFCLMSGGLLLVIAGTICAAILAILAFTGKLQSVHGTVSPHGGIYVEAFAVWLILHLTFGLIASLFVTESNALIVSAFALMLTGIAALWPVLQGVSWKQVCSDIGLNCGTKNPLLEIVYGIVGYLSMLPFLLLNVLILVLVMKLIQQGPGEELATPQMPSHPIIQWATESGLFAKCMILFLASGIAPVLEETMFRGFLYRHLRDASGRWRRFVSIIASAGFSSFIFAIIHPQGWVAVPTLMTLAIGFCLLREWRGSLIASMTAHSLHNGLATVMMLLILGST